MDYAIISAGEGARLKQEGVSTPKPLVLLNGVPLIELIANRANSISIIVNNLYPEVFEFLKQKQSALPVPLHLVQATTPSSLHSFYKLLPCLTAEKFCLTTVDTVFKEEEFQKYIYNFTAETQISGSMAVTSFVDDEKPLYVEVQPDGRITNFFDSNNGNCKYVSGGVYCLTKDTLSALQLAHDSGISRMRNFQRLLIEKGYWLTAYPFSKIIDIDHAKDIEQASLFIKGI